MKNKILRFAVFPIAAILLLSGCAPAPAQNSPSPSAGASPSATASASPTVTQQISPSPSSSLTASPSPSVVPSPTPITTAQWFPMTQGSTWQYLGEGNEYASFTREVVYTGGNLAQIKEDNGGTVSMSVYASTSNQITRVFFQGEEYTSANFLAAPANDNTVILAAPVQAGAQWSDGSVTRTITATGVSVTTPAGTFSGCVKVEIPGTGSTSYEYYKDGVGLVKREFITGATTITSTLQSYQINP